MYGARINNRTTACVVLRHTTNMIYYFSLFLLLPFPPPALPPSLPSSPPYRNLSTIQAVKNQDQPCKADPLHGEKCWKQDTHRS